MACWGGAGHVSVDAPYLSVCSALGCARDFGNTHHHHILFWIVSLTQSLCLCQQEWDCENLLSQAFTLWVRTVDGTDGHREEAAQWNTDLCTDVTGHVCKNSISALRFYTAELPVEEEADIWSCWQQSFSPPAVPYLEASALQPIQEDCRDAETHLTHVESGLYESC